MRIIYYGQYESVWSWRVLRRSSRSNRNAVKVRNQLPDPFKFERSENCPSSTCGASAGSSSYLRKERRRAFVCGLRLGRGANGTCTSTGGGCGYYLEDRGCALSI